MPHRLRWRNAVLAIKQNPKQHVDPVRCINFALRQPGRLEFRNQIVFDRRDRSLGDIGDNLRRFFPHHSSISFFGLCSIVIIDMLIANPSQR